MIIKKGTFGKNAGNRGFFPDAVKETELNLLEKVGKHRPDVREKTRKIHAKITVPCFGEFEFDICTSTRRPISTPKYKENTRWKRPHLE
jgi:hypothetical protein